MTFKAVIGRATTSLPSKKNVLTDGRQACSYQDIPDAFRTIDRLFREYHIHREHCLAIECSNSLPSALLLLYLFENGYSFVLLPPSQQKPRMRNGQSVPRFCRHHIVAEPLSINSSLSLHEQLKTCLRIEENPRFIQDKYESDTATNSEPKLYLRTSGSMGSSKMVVHSHAKLLGNAQNCVKRYKVEAIDRITIPVPIFHLYGLGAAFLCGIIAGASIDLQNNTNIIRFLERERQFNPNIVFLVPTLCDMLLMGQRSSKTYRLVITTGDRMKEDAFLAFESRFGCLINQYGSTEMGAIAGCEPDDALEVRAGTVGRPMQGVAVRLEKTNSEKSDESSSIGELYCRHSYGFDGYVDEDARWIDRRTHDQLDWFKTGDLGKVGQDGRIEVLCRCDHSTNRDGHLVMFADIEKAIEIIEGINNVLVLARGESKRGERIVAYCALSTDNHEDTECLGREIRTSCFEILPRYAIPDEVVVVRSFPTLPNGKIDRQALIKKNMDNPE